jgi:hypothetical protein
MNLITGETEPSLPALVLGDRQEQFITVKVRPQDIGEIEFCVSRLPEQKITDPVFATRPDQQVRIGQAGRIEIPGK